MPRALMLAVLELDPNEADARIEPQNGAGLARRALDDLLGGGGGGIHQPEAGQADGTRQQRLRKQGFQNCVRAFRAGLVAKGCSHKARERSRFLRHSVDTAAFDARRTSRSHQTAGRHPGKTTAMALPSRPDRRLQLRPA
jgi:hypothetical protein